MELTEKDIKILRNMLLNKINKLDVIYHKSYKNGLEKQIQRELKLHRELLLKVVKMEIGS